MRFLLRFASGLGIGLIIGLWLPLLMPMLGMPPQTPPAEEAPAKSNEASPTKGETQQAPPRKVKASVTVAETLHTGDPRDTSDEPEAISGQLPRNLRFTWKDDPASGLAPAFLWIKDGSYLLGTERIAPQDGNIRRAYAFDAPAVLPDQFDGRLIFHRKLLQRLLNWSADLPEDHAKQALVVGVERIDPKTVRLLLPAISEMPATQLTVTL